MEERLEALENALWYTTELMSALKEVGGHDDMVTALEGTESELRCQIEEAEQRQHEAYVEERRQMTQDYWRSVI